ncbi:MAG: Fe-S cluster assembly protein SufD [Cyclobacteriaceae bacterium]|nr:Fe-S cluster assembly protein SufD [Cyclobacteriaceae bacterium HetDA_MAG_MS6]
MEETLTLEDVISAAYHGSSISKPDSILKNFKETALSEMEAMGLPHKKHEEYKYTPIRKVIEKMLQTGDADNEYIPNVDVSSFVYQVEGNHLIFVNGEFRPDLSIINITDGLEITKIDESSFKEFGEVINKASDQSYNAFTAWNSAMFQNGLSIEVAKKTNPAPIFIYHFYQSESLVLSHPRILVSVESSAAVDITEKSIFTNGQVFSNNVTEVLLQQNAKMSLTKLQNHDEQSVLHDGVHVRQARDSRFDINTFSFAGKMIRNNLNISLDDENCETNMHGLYLLNGTTHVDNHTAVDHKKPHSLSNELYKGIVDGKAKAVFNGKIFVRPGAQQTNAFQSNNNVSLSEGATINTKPQLEIWADDVKCSHGCTIGQLDEEAIFYLRARGLDEVSAKAMLLNAFAEETLQNVTQEVVNSEITEMISNRLQ